VFLSCVIYIQVFVHFAYSERGDKTIKELGNLPQTSTFFLSLLHSFPLFKSQQANFPYLH